MTKKETIVLTNLAKAWNTFLKLKVLHADDMNDFRFHIHGAQNIILARRSLKKIKS